MASRTSIWLILLPLVIQVVPSDQQMNNGLLDTLNSGMKIAQNFLASESVASKVAEFVVKAFEPGNRQKTKRPSQNEDYSNQHNERPDFNRPNQNSDNQDKPDLNGNEYIDNGYEDNNVYETPMTPLRQIVKLFGLQPNQISAVAINALVFVAQMISTFLAGPRRPSRSYKDEEPTSWILTKNSSKLQNILSTAKNESLMDLIEETISQHNAEDTTCIRLLVCKITPFVYKMQEAVFGNEDKTEKSYGRELKGSASLYRHLPSATELNKRSDVCENKYKDCNLDE